eukprot:CAMPEP_0119021644 /NCGR_PEP_ID=MMETSP1176-20130426/26412_1 /TAXON_ID=265551 /ORGANISM="Synedropsis recta cf, Strain CCMP1620" /LENGTH=205 /DNA_ID=CAMNT_0006976301 /DNA_START=108 /DNA_END=725 /DNA_ORIENTATION=-
MKLIISALLAATSLTVASAKGTRGNNLKHVDGSDDSSSNTVVYTDRCANPKRAVRNLLMCVGNNDAVCAAAAYDPGFQRFHNEVFTGQISITDPTFWEGAFTFFPRFEFDIKFARNAGKNMASVRYIETVTSTYGTNLGLPASSVSPFGQVVVQHEHALVTVNNNCNIIKWDQYGDNKEQTDVDNITSGIFCILDPTTCMPSVMP